MASQKSMLLLLLLAFVVVVVSATEPGDISESDIEDAVERLLGDEELSVAETEQLLELIMEGFSDENGMLHMLDDPKFEDAYDTARTYLDMCKPTSSGEYETRQFYFDRFFPDTLAFEISQDRSPSLIAYLYDCQDRR